MNRSFAGTLVASAIALAVGACGDDSSSGYGYASGGGGDCSAYTTCGSCTPVPGCGWCFNSQGGTCTTDPDQCANASEFTWTWNPSGCPDVDASVNPVDGGAGASRDATSGSETGSGSSGGGRGEGGASSGEAGPGGPAADGGSGGSATEGGVTPADSGAGG